MKTIKFYTSVILSLLFLNLFSQSWNLPGNANVTATSFLGSTNAFPLQLRTVQSQPMLFQTFNTNRMKINPNISYQVNLLGTQPKNGFTLIGPNTPNGSGTGSLYDNSWGAFSLLHLNGEGAFVEDWGYRNWMRTGITFTGNRDLAYIRLSATPL